MILEQSISGHGRAVSRLGNEPYLAVLPSLDLLLPQSALHFACKRVGCAGTVPILEGLQSRLACESMATRGGRAIYLPQRNVHRSIMPSVRTQEIEAKAMRR